MHRPSEDAKEGRIDYLTVDDLETLLFVANLGAIEMHPLHSRCSDTGHPDYCFFDLDPFQPYTYEDVLTVARHIKVVLDQLGLVGYPKTSGATGLQIYLPIEAGRWTYGEVRAFVGTCGRMIGRADPDRVTMAWRVADRSGKIFIDHNMNRQGANIAAAYSLRPEPRAPVSTPLTWDEVTAGGFEPQDFRIDNVWDRFGGWAICGRRCAGPPNDLAPAMEALGVEGRGSERSAPPYRRAKAVETKTSDEIALGVEGSRALRVRAPAGIRRGGHERARAGQRGRRRQLVRDPQASSDAAALRRAPRTRRRVAVLGGPEGPADAEGRQADGGPDRGPPPRVRGVRGHDPRRPLRRGRGPYLRRRVVRADRMDRHEGLVPAARPPLPGSRVPSRQDEDGLARVPRSAQTEPLIAAPPRFDPMLAEGGHEAFDDDHWWFEPKLDGIRCLAELGTGQTILRSRTGRDVTSAYPELHMIHELVDQVNAVIDGEIVAVDAEGRNSFEALQQRMNLRNEREIKRVSKTAPVSLAVFDLLWLDGKDTTGLPLEQRRELLSLVVEEDERLQLMAHADGSGKEFTKAAEALGLEGVVAKRTGSKYLPGRRSPDWRKIKLVSTQDCVILGWTPGQGGRAGTFGALLVGAIDGGRSAGSDRSAAASPSLCGQRPRAPPALGAPGSADRRPEVGGGQRRGFRGVPARVRGRVLEITKSTKKMRAPVYKGLREDKLPEDCVLERPVAATA